MEFLPGERNRLWVGRIRLPQWLPLAIVSELAR
jgi:hypothetical protein